MKRSCKGCRALEIGCFGKKSKCNLGYKTTEKKVGEYELSRLTPLEECPKPLTCGSYHRMVREQNQGSEVLLR